MPGDETNMVREVTDKEREQSRYPRTARHIVPPRTESRNAFILWWWASAHDQLLAQQIKDEQWAWADTIYEKIVDMTPGWIIRVWRVMDPLCWRYAWYNILYYFAMARAERLGLTKAIREPQWKVCPLCDKRFVEDSLPPPFVKRLGIGQLDFCAPCLSSTLFDDAANDRISRRKTLAYLRDLTDVLQRVPPQGFGAGTDDLRGLSTEERLAVLEVLRRKPTVRRVKELFGSWFEALIEAGVLEDDVVRMRLGTRCLAKDGHICFSLGEKTVDDTLHSLGVAHEKEVRYPEGGFRADFAAPGVFIEYFGLSGDADYDAKTKAKQRICKKHGIELISLFPRDLTSSRRLKSKLGRGLSLPYFSPVETTLAHTSPCPD